MKLYLLLPLLLLMHIAHAQGRNNNKSREVEQLQQLKQTLSRKIDTLHLQLAEQASSMEDVRKKLDQLKKESYNQDRPDISSKEQELRLTGELANITNLFNNLQKKFDQCTAMLDKTINLQKELEDKIITLTRESNQQK